MRHSVFLAALLPCAAAAESVPAAAVPVATPALERIGDTALDAASVLAWPLHLQTADTLLLAGATIGTVSLLGADTGLYRRVGRVNWTLKRKSIFDTTVHLGDGLVDLLVLGAFAFGDERARRTSITGIEALISAGATSVLMKHIFRVPRPSHGARDKRYFRKFRDDAFPSGHTMAAFATASVIAAEYPGTAPYVYGLATLVGFSVMKRGWHWPSDVLAGGALGVLIGRVSVRVNNSRVSVALTPGGLGVQTEM